MRRQSGIGMQMEGPSGVQRGYSHFNSQAGGQEHAHGSLGSPGF